MSDPTRPAVSGGETGPFVNTDRELWRETPDDFYAPSLHVTVDGGIGMNVGGYVVVMPIRNWHALAVAGVFESRVPAPAPAAGPSEELSQLRAENARLREIVEEWDALYLKQHGITYTELRERVRGVRDGKTITHTEAIARLRAPEDRPTQQGERNG